ncbi:hypothetical protein ACTWP5_25120 [Streptomyces sp. 4N509B]|uniref:hypothetical protein n=1 Tax=Streptomyces sp. 4N509B TaxID=3457413 RepID=UPI003FD29270
MEAGPRESDGRTDGIPGRRLERDPLDDAPSLDTTPLDSARLDGEAALAGEGAGESYGELRPSRRLRLTQLAPIVLLGLLGSLMFAFPLAFAFDETGAVVAMLGLLLGCSAAGWGMMAARRVGHTWPGLPARGSDARPDWRMVLLYAAIVGVLAALAVWRVAALR